MKEVLPTTRRGTRKEGNKKRRKFKLKKVELGK